MEVDLEAMFLREGMLAPNVTRVVDHGFSQKRVLKLMSEQDILETGVTPLGLRKRLWEIIKAIASPTPMGSLSPPLAANAQPGT